MERMSLNELLAGNAYPGRGICVGMAPDGGQAVVIYFIMGRSENSRNRVFVREGEELVIHPFDESKVEDPSLIIYTPIRRAGALTVVGNGDQTDTAVEGLLGGRSFGDALSGRTYEPDAPHYTPRITGLLKPASDGFSFELSEIRRGEDGSEIRSLFGFSGMQPGEGRFISTYKEDGSPLPSWSGEPRCVILEGENPREMARGIWRSLNESNRVALAVRFIRPGGADFEMSIIGRHQGEM